MKTLTTLTDLIVNQINEMDRNELVSLNNAYCRAISSDGEVYENDEEFFNLFFEGKTFEAVRAAHFGNYNFADDYVRFNGYGNLETINYFSVEDLEDLPQNIAEYANDNRDDFDMFDFDAIESELEDLEIED